MNTVISVAKVIIETVNGETVVRYYYYTSLNIIARESYCKFLDAYLSTVNRVKFHVTSESRKL